MSERTRKRLCGAGLWGCAVVAVALVGGCGADDGVGDLRWESEPHLIQPARLPQDRVLSGVVRNDTLDRVDVDAKDVGVVNADGRRVPAVAIFLEGFTRGDAEPGEPEPASEQLRTGKIGRVLPGETLPVTVSWRQPVGAGAPVRVEWPGGSLPIPEKPPVQVR